MIDALVLAAGLGRRMGTSKPLSSVDGRPALGVILEMIDAVGLMHPIVVLGHCAKAICSAIDLDACRIVVNEAPERGMGSSLALGIRAAGERWDGILVFHADMPWIQPATVRHVLDAVRRGARLAAPIHQGRRGFPVFFAADCCSDLLATLSGESGGRAYLAAHEADLVLVPVEDPGCVTDFDQPEDLAKGGTRCATCA